MWDETRRQRFQKLRDRATETSLSPDEAAELARLSEQLERMEADYLSGATQRLREDRERIERQNISLEALVRRKNSLRDRLQSVLADAEAEREG